jgi:GAF domain-containing protein
MPVLKPRDVTFLDLRDATLCSECELISYNNTEHCLACGSRAVLSLSRVLGGSLRGEQRVRVLANEPLKTVIEMRAAPVLRLVPPPLPMSHVPVPLMASGPLAPQTVGTSPAHSAMKLVVDRAYRLSRSGGAAVATERHGRMVCEARMGPPAPALGTEVRGGLSALSLQSGKTLRCDLADDDPRVDSASCRQLGARSIVAAPVTNLDRVLGLVTVFSPQPYAFDDRDVAVVQWLAGMMAVVFTNAQADLSLTTQSATRSELIGRA